MLADAAVWPAIKMAIEGLYDTYYDEENVRKTTEGSDQSLARSFVYTQRWYTYLIVTVSPSGGQQINYRKRDLLGYNFYRSAETVARFAGKTYVRVQ